MQAHAEQTYPHECCGLLLGTFSSESSDHRALHQVQPLANTWDQAKHEVHPDQAELTATRRYWASPAQIMATQKYARTQGWDIIGVYHSHPDQAAIPSECDRQWAWPQYSYVIVAVARGTAEDLKSWMLDEQMQFQPQDVMVTAVA